MHHFSLILIFHELFEDTSYTWISICFFALKWTDHFIPLSTDFSKCTDHKHDDRGTLLPNIPFLAGHALDVSHPKRIVHILGWANKFNFSPPKFSLQCKHRGHWQTSMDSEAGRKHRRTKRQSSGNPSSLWRWLMEQGKDQREPALLKATKPGFPAFSSSKCPGQMERLCYLHLSQISWRPQLV